MKRDWKPGDVAVINFTSGPERAMWIDDQWVVTGGRAKSGHYSVARPLVVLDLSPHEVMRALEALRESGGMVAMQVAGKLEEATRESKPPEPTGLGAVVEDERGELWIRRAPHRTPWLHAEGKTFPQKWPDIAAVRVLSEGIDERRTP